VNAFNPLTGWYDTDVIGIDTGITLGDGGESANGIRLEYVHEERDSAARHAARGPQEVLSGSICAEGGRELPESPP